MRSITITTPGPPNVLEVRDVPVPSPARGEVLVRVEAAGVNRPDILQRLGRYTPPPGVTDVPGLEVAGVVHSVGADVTRWRAGDRVCALVAGGGYAEYCVAPAPQCLPIPHGLDAMHAAAIPETYFTVWSNLFERGGLRDGERVLVHGGTSGIGTTAIQLAIAFGATAIATAGADDKCQAIERLGAAAINYRRDDFVERVHALTGGAGVDVVLDIVGGEYVERNLRCLAMDGRLILIGLLGGSRAEIGLGTIMQKRITFTGSTLRPRTIDEKGAIARALGARVWPLLSNGRVRPIVQDVLPLDQAAEAHRRLEAGEIIGKIVLTP